MPQFFSNGYSCFGPYYPCPATTSSCNCAENTVVNPSTSLSFAFLSLSEPTTVEINETIPLTIVQSQGDAITQADEGALKLTTGRYLVQYITNSILGVGGVNSFVLTLGGVEVPMSFSTSQGSSGNIVNMGNIAFITVENSGVLRLINRSSNNVEVRLANLLIQKI